MARLPRFDVPGFAQHVVQRGNDRQPCFAAEEDYVRYRQELREASIKHGCAIHAYVLMTNHVHLLVTPNAPGAVSRMMQMLGRRYVGSFNARYRRSGTLWEGRFKSCLVDSEDYLLRCYRYIELNPVRARMVAMPSDYGWSSYRCNALGNSDPVLTPHSTYLALGTQVDARCAAYAAIVSEASCEKEVGKSGTTWFKAAFGGAADFRNRSRRCMVVAPLSGHVVGRLRGRENEPGTFGKT